MTDTVRVPREPTEEMLDAGGLVVAGGKPPFGYEIQNAASVWDAMLAASPQEEGSSADTHPPQPDALPGDLREKVARILDPRLFELIEALNNASGEPPDLRKAASAMRDARMETALNKADAILSLIQSERGGA